MIEKIKSSDAEIVYEVLGNGPDVVLLHPFPVNREFWRAVAEPLSSRYRLIMPDLRGHGDSSVGDGAATMAKHAGDVARICDELGVGHAVFAGVSIGGYVLFELWRQNRERFAGLVLSDTKAAADTEEARSMRLQSAEDVEKFGPERFIEAQVPRLLGETTRTTRPDKVERAVQMMRKATAKGIAAVQRGMAARPDSTPTLFAIDVPALLIFGEEDQLTTTAEAQGIQQKIRNSKLQLVPRAGHYAIYEQPEDAVRILRPWLDVLHGRVG